MSLLDNHIKRCCWSFLFRFCCLKIMLCLFILLDKKNDSFCAGAKSMQIHPLFIHSVFPLFVWGPWAKPNHKKGGECEHLLASGRQRWPHSWVTKTPLWWWREPMKQGYFTPTDQHRRRPNMCKNGAPVKPTLFLTLKKEERKTKT